MNNKEQQLSILFPDMSLTFADFFCGCGGFSLGFIEAGLKCISAMDFSPEAVATYWRNLCYKGWSHLYVSPENQGGIKKLKKILNNGETANYLFPNGVPDNWLSVKEKMPCYSLFLYSILDIEPEEWMDMLGVRPGDVKIFIGGPPCQGFSTSNTSRNMYDERNQLPLRFIHYAKVCKPDYVIIENVPGLLSLGKKKGDSEGPFVEWIRDAFDKAGYSMEYQVHDAADYGVPQHRKRVLFMAARKGLQPPMLMPGEYGKGLGKKPHVTVLEAIGDFPPVKSGECWGKDVLHPYGYNARDGYVICPQCLKYNKHERENCHHCKHSLSNPIRGGVLRIPRTGVLLDTQHEINNEVLRQQYNN